MWRETSLLAVMIGPRHRRRARRLQLLRPSVSLRPESVSLRRPMEDPAEGSPSQKRAKSPERRGRKREWDAAVESATQEERQEAGASSSGNACGGAQSRAGADPATTSIQEKVCSEVLLRLDKTSVPETVREMNQLYKSLGMSGVDVAEIYNPERFTSEANAFGLQPGFAIDLTLQKDDKDDHWDLSKTEHQKKLKGLLWKEKPAFLIGSPPCGPFSPLQNLSNHRRTAAQNEAILRAGCALTWRLRRTWSNTGTADTSFTEVGESHASKSYKPWTASTRRRLQSANCTRRLKMGKELDLCGVVRRNG